MKKTFYILKYKNGAYVKRDDSTGPMSTGGYPSETEDVERATRWSSVEEAAAYQEHFKREFMEDIFPLVITYEEYPSIPSPLVWKMCNHNCMETVLSTSNSAKHYLDCPIWQKKLAASRSQHGVK